MPGHRPHLADNAGLSGRQAVAANIGRAAGGRPNGRDPAKRRGDAQRAADVIAEPERRSAGRDHGRLAAARAAARSRQIPRIVGPAVQWVVGLGIDHELRHIGLGDRNRARRAPSRHIGIVAALDVVTARRQSERRCRAGEIEAFLDGHRQAGKRAECVAAGQRLVDVRGGRSGALRQIRGDGVERAIDGLEPGNKMLDHLGGRELARGDAGHDLAGRQVLQVVVPRPVLGMRCRAGGGRIGERHGMDSRTCGADRASRATLGPISGVCQFASMVSPCRLQCTRRPIMPNGCRLSRPADAGLFVCRAASQMVEDC